jgi:glutamyl-tRNA synthetase
LVVVCDDAAMGVTQVIRGDDLMASTPRQILLYRALGLAGPTFGHIPLVLGSDGRRLAKREDAIKLATLRESGVDPSHLLAMLARSCGIEAIGGRVDPRSLIGRFDFHRLPRSPWIAPAFPVL